MYDNITLDHKVNKHITVGKGKAYAQCYEVPISFPWEVAEQLLSFALPFLEGLKEQVHIRTGKERANEVLTIERKLEQRKRSYWVRLALIHNVRKVYREGIKYKIFSENCLNMIDKYGFINKSTLNTIYHDARARDCVKMLERGISKAEIAKKYGIHTTSLGKILERGRKPKDTTKSTQSASRWHEEDSALHLLNAKERRLVESIVQNAANYSPQASIILDAMAELPQRSKANPLQREYMMLEG